MPKPTTEPRSETVQVLVSYGETVDVFALGPAEARELDGVRLRTTHPREVVVAAIRTERRRHVWVRTAVDAPLAWEHRRDVLVLVVTLANVGRRDGTALTRAVRVVPRWSRVGSAEVST